MEQERFRWVLMLFWVVVSAHVFVKGNNRVELHEGELDAVDVAMG